MVDFKACKEVFFKDLDVREEEKYEGRREGEHFLSTVPTISADNLFHLSQFILTLGRSFDLTGPQFSHL